MGSASSGDGALSTQGGNVEQQGIEISGKRYELPTLDTITLDEERILYVYSDTIVQDFVPPHPEWSNEEKANYQALQMRKIRNPEFKKALAHIAYKRQNPTADDAEIQSAIGLVNALEVDIAMIRGDDDDPPAQTSQKEPSSKSDTSEDLSCTDSGRSTESGSGQVAAIPEATGTTESDTSSPGAPRIELVS